jgi:outer membrane protein assembly factor BamB
LGGCGGCTRGWNVPVRGRGLRRRRELGRAFLRGRRPRRARIGELADGGGSFANDRYSELDEITTDNVSDLQGVWKTDLRNSGTQAKYSGESQPVVYNGVLYVTTGMNDVFAVDVETGKILWQYKAKLNQKITTVCCGWLNRGVAIGDGRVYQGQLDGNVVALDAKTGEQLWKRQLVRWQAGQTITAAPIYADGRIYLGVVGADLGTRGFLEAMDAETGESVWRYYTIPGPGENPGGDSWPKDSDAYLRGGGAIWQAPAYDPDLGLLYFSTGNAGPDWDGSVREGDNKWTVSIVAVEAETGTFRWGYQMVHHDIWDLDAASPVVLFNASDDRKGVAQAGKTGWLYMLDRETGKPLYGIDEKPVPQDPRQHTATTQPIPRNGEFIPHEPVPQSEVERIKKSLTPEQKNLEVVRRARSPPSTRSPATGPGRSSFPKRAMRARARRRATSSSSVATTASSRRTTRATATGSGTSRRAPERTTRRRSSSTTESSTSPSSPRATASRRPRTGTSSGSSGSTARSARLRLRERVPAPSTVAKAAARRRRATPRPARPCSPPTAQAATAPWDGVATAAPTCRTSPIGPPSSRR